MHVCFIIYFCVYFWYWSAFNIRYSNNVCMEMILTFTEYFSTVSFTQVWIWTCFTLLLKVLDINKSWTDKMFCLQRPWLVLEQWDVIPAYNLWTAEACIKDNKICPTHHGPRIWKHVHTVLWVVTTAVIQRLACWEAWTCA